MTKVACRRTCAVSCRRNAVPAGATVLAVETGREICTVDALARHTVTDVVVAMAVASPTRAVLRRQMRLTVVQRFAPTIYVCIYDQ